MRFQTLGAVLFLSLLVAPIAASQPTGYANGKIAYPVLNTHYGPTRTVRAVDPLGGHEQTLARCSRPISFCWVPALAWSRDGKKLAFLRGRPAGTETKNNFVLFVTDANGRHVRRVAACGACRFGLESWSPDGSTIALAGPCPTQPTFGAACDLTLVTVKTGSRRLVAPACADIWGDHIPAWSPDGSKIAFGCGASLYVATRTGTQAHVIATTPGDCCVNNPSWSPDGKTLAFDAADSIFTVGVDGSHLTRLVAGQPPYGPGFPSWSPDGSRIVYLNSQSGPPGAQVGVWVMNADGTRKRDLNYGCCEFAAPVWSPDGGRIAFALDPEGLIVMNADGSGLHRVGPTVIAFAWQPVP